MKRIFLGVAVCIMTTLTAFSQTPTPARPAASGAAPAAASGGTGAEGKVAYINTAQFRVGIEVVFDRPLVLAGHQDHPLDPRRDSLLDRVLDRRSVDDRQELLGDSLRCGEEAGAQSRSGKHRFSDSRRHVARIVTDGTAANILVAP